MNIKLLLLSVVTEWQLKLQLKTALRGSCAQCCTFPSSSSSSSDDASSSEFGGGSSHNPFKRLSVVVVKVGEKAKG